MTAIWVRARHELRTRWRALIVLGILVGLSGGAAVAAFAGARRTNSAFPRMLSVYRSVDLVVSVNEDLTDAQRAAALAKVRSLPQVADSGLVTLFDFLGFITPSGKEISFPQVFALGAAEPTIRRSIYRLKITQGRAPDPARADEVAVNATVAERYGIHVGDHLQPKSNFPEVKATFPPVTVTALEIAPGEFQSLAGATVPAIHMTQAFTGLVPPDAVDPDLAVRLKGGREATPAFRQEIESSDLPVEVGFDFAQQENDVQNSTGFESVGLWLLAGLLAVATLGVVGQAIGRQMFVDSAEYPALRALGMTRGQFLLLGAIRAGAIGLIGGLLAIVVGWALSSLTPIGVARLAEPSPGLAFDAFALPVGALAVLGLVLLAAATPAWRAARARTQMAGGELFGQRPSLLGRAASASGLPPTAAAGLRFAVEPGRGRSTVPVRSALFGSAIGVAALVAAFTFTSSFNRLLSEPRLTGFTFDLFVGTDPGPATAQIQKALERDPAVTKIAGITFLDNAQVGDRRYSVLAMDTRVTQPSIIEGRAPFTDDEIVLGPRALERLHTRIGGTVRVVPDSQRSPNGKAHTFRVVGTLVMPSLSFQLAPTGEGAAISLEGLAALDPRSTDGFFVTLKAGADPLALIQRLRALQRYIFAGSRADRGDVQNLRRVSSLPVTLAAVIVFLAAATIAHALITSVRRRRRDLAILKTIGFVGSQLRSAVAWQASTMGVLALVVGIPLGIAAGRWAWVTFVNQLYLVPEPAVPLVTIVLLLPITLVLVNLFAAFPGRSAARTQPAVALRAE